MTQEKIADRILEVLSHHPAGFFSDFDGVLSEIAPTPSSAFAYPGAADALARVAAGVDAAGIITGRAVPDVANMVPIDDLIVVGNHGLEWWERGNSHDHPAGTEAIAAVERAIADTQAAAKALVDTSAMIWENKRLSGTVHFRNVDDPASVEDALLPIVEQVAEANNLRFTGGKMIFEFRPRAQVSKGTALSELVSRYGLRSVVFVGDDVTDVDGFRSLAELRQDGLSTLAVGVVTPDSHPDVARYADVIVGSVAEFVDVLNAVADGLEVES